MSGTRLNVDQLDELRAWVGNLDCQDSAPGSQWSCREGDGTGLWCESCLAAHQFDTLVAEVARLARQVDLLGKGLSGMNEMLAEKDEALTEDVRTRCTCGSTVPGMVEWMTQHAMYDNHQPTFERRMVTGWQEFKP